MKLLTHICPMRCNIAFEHKDIWTWLKIRIKRWTVFIYVSMKATLYNFITYFIYTTCISNSCFIAIYQVWEVCIANYTGINFVDITFRYMSNLNSLNNFTSLMIIFKPQTALVLGKIHDEAAAAF
jgi:hypothetical protein